MKRKLGFLHTLRANIAVFDDLIQESGCECEVMHHVNESVLMDILRLGQANEDIADRVRTSVLELKEAGADLVVCTCSSIGAIAEEMNDSEPIEIQRIDRAMADEAVRQGGRIVLAASLSTTLGPTRDLLKSSAEKAGKSISIKELVISAAWACYEVGDHDGYIEEIAKELRRAFSEGDAIVLAQASMTGAASLVSDCPIPIFSSPRLGVNRALDTLRNW